MLYISSVNKEELDVTDGHLSIIAVDSSKITGLQEALSAKVNQRDYQDTVDVVSNLSDLMAQHVIKLEAHDSEIESLW
jgi:hypothetical protein